MKEITLEYIPLGSVVLIEGEEYVVAFTEETSEGRTYLGILIDGEKGLREFSLNDVEEIVFLGYIRENAISQNFLLN